MPNMIHNELKIETHNFLIDRLLKFQQEIESEAVEISRIRTTEKGDSLTLEMSFRTHADPPVAVYRRIEEYTRQNNIESEALEAEATFLDERDDCDDRYRWLFEGDGYEVIETHLTYSQEEKVKHAARQAAEELIRERVEEMRKERDDLDAAIRVLEKRYLKPAIPF